MFMRNLGVIPIFFSSSGIGQNALYWYKTNIKRMHLKVNIKIKFKYC